MRNAHRDIDPLIDQRHLAVQQMEPGAHLGMRIEEGIEDRPQHTGAAGQGPGQGEQAARGGAFAGCQSDRLLPVRPAPGGRLRHSVHPPR